MPAHLLLGKLAGRAPAYVVAVLDRLVPPLQKTLTAKLKADAVKQEVGLRRRWLPTFMFVTCGAASASQHCVDDKGSGGLF